MYLNKNWNNTGFVTTEWKTYMFHFYTSFTMSINSNLTQYFINFFISLFGAFSIQLIHSKFEHQNFYYKGWKFIFDYKENSSSNYRISLWCLRSIKIKNIFAFLNKKIPILQTQRQNQYCILYHWKKLKITWRNFQIQKTIQEKNFGIIIEISSFKIVFKQYCFAILYIFSQNYCTFQKDFLSESDYFSLVF